MNIPTIKIMGILNITPDSFSDGGDFLDINKASIQVKKLRNQGANIIDIGGESSRPYANIISANEELKRIIPIIKVLKKQSSNIFISVDTYKPEVMQQSLELGVDMINDIYALKKIEEKNAIDILANSKCDICLMHMQENPKTMQNKPKYNNIIDDIKSFFEKRISYCVNNGIDEKRLILDPGIGFGKSYEHNITIVKNFFDFKTFGLRTLIGLSKKSMFNTMLGNRATKDRVVASTIAASIAIQNGCDIIRTHNPLDISDMLKIVQTLK